MTTLNSAPLLSARIADAQAQAEHIADAPTSSVDPGTFVFFAAFDGTNNGVDPQSDGSGDKQNTAVAQLWQQAALLNSNPSANVQARYYPGVGTPGTLLGSSGYNPTALNQQSLNTATLAYQNFALEAHNWLLANPDGSVTSMITSFSRGGTAAAIFAQMLYENGLVYGAQVIIPPGTVGAISAALIIDPVLTGEYGNQDFPNTVENLTVVRAQNEYRKFFDGANYNDPNAHVYSVTGNHGDAGDVYDDGLGGIYLQAYTEFFENAGFTNIPPLAPSRAYNSSKPVYIHTETGAAYDYPTNCTSAPRQTVPVGTPVTVSGSGTSFTAYNGSIVLGGAGFSTGVANATFYVLPNSDGATITGFSEAITVYENSVINFNSTSLITNTVNAVQGKVNTIVLGTNDTINITGINNSINANNDIINLAAGASITVNGSGDTINVAKGATVSGNNSGLASDNILFYVASHKLRFNANTTFGSSNYTNLGTVVTTLTAGDPQTLGNLSINTSTDADSFTFSDGMVITPPGITGDEVVSDPGGIVAPLQVLSDYLTDLGDPLTPSQLSQLNFNYLNQPGTAYTVTGAVTKISDTSAEIIYDNADYYPYLPNFSGPGAVIAGQNTANITVYGTTASVVSVPATDILVAGGDISQDTISGIQTLEADGLELTSTQFNSFPTVIGGIIDFAEGVGSASFTITTGGVVSLASPNVTGTFDILAASGWDGTTLIGNNQNNQYLEASLFGNDTLVAGNGTGDVLIAGEGVDVLTGGTGGDTFDVANGLAAGSTLTGGSGEDTLIVGDYVTDTDSGINEDALSGDISQASVSGIETLQLDATASLTAAEFESFSTFTDSGGLFLVTGGTYSLVGKTLETGNSFSVDVGSDSAATFISNDTVGLTQFDLIASGAGDITLTAGITSGDYLSATGSGDDVLTAGDGFGDNLSASGSGDNALTAGDGTFDYLSASGDGDNILTAGSGTHDILSASGAGNNTLTVGNGIGDTLTASNGTDLLVAGDGNYDVLTVTTGGNTLVTGNGIGDMLSAQGGANTLVGGNGGDTFDLNDYFEEATGGSGNDLFNVPIISNGTSSGVLADLSGLTIDGGGGVNTLDAAFLEIDISQAVISNIQNIIASTVTLTAAEFAELTTIDATAITAASPGTYALLGDTLIDMQDEGVDGGVTLIGNNADTESLNGIANNDTVIAGTGTDDIIGVAGSDGLAIAHGANAEVVAEGANSTATGYGISTVLALDGYYSTANAYGAEAMIYADGTEDTLNTFAANATAYVGAGDTVNISGGSSTIYEPGIGGSSFRFSDEFGQSVIDFFVTPTISVSSVPAKDEIYFAAGITDENLWLKRVGSNLQIDEMGTTQDITITNWFSGSGDQVQGIILSDGYQLTNTRVAPLVSAMAAYSIANPGFNPTLAAAAPSDPTLQAAIDTAWNSAVTIIDTAANVALELDSLQTLAAAGELAAISLSDTGTPTLAVTATQLANDAAALGKITGGYDLSVSDVLAANAASVGSTAHITSLSVADMAANVAGNLDALQGLGTELSSISLTDIGVPSLTVSGTPFLADTTALNNIAGTYYETIAIGSGQTFSDGATVPAEVLGLQASSNVEAFLSGTTSVLGFGANTLWIGDYGTASLSFGDGNTIAAGEIDIAVGSTATGAVYEYGDGSVLEGSILAVGGSSKASGGEGQVGIDSGATVDVSNVQVWSNGLITLTGGELETDPVSISGGMISGYGTITGAIADSGAVAASGGTLEVTGAVSGSGTLAIQPGSTLLLDGAVGPGVTVAFQSDGSGVLELADPAGMQGTITGQVSGDAVADIPCYVAGTRIRTAHGEVPVESLAAGDLAQTASGELAPITWIGHRHVDCRRHPDPQEVWPVRVTANAFGEGLPHGDLLLSPDHAVHVDGVLIPVKYLVNGANVAQEPRDHVTYFHVELNRHDILLAEGLPCESYLDTGNRSAFANGSAQTMLHPQFAPLSWDNACAPLTTCGPQVIAARLLLLARLPDLGYGLTDEVDLRIEVGGKSFRAARVLGDLHRFLLPAGTTAVRVASGVTIPAALDLANEDCRTLGVRIAGITANGRMIRLESPALGEGFWEIENGGGAAWRWTNGAGELTLGWSEGPVLLELLVRDIPLRWVRRDAEAALSGQRHAA